MTATREIEPELLQKLGLVIVRWSLIETWISDLFTAMTEGNKGAMMVVTANVSQSTITGWIRTLLDVFDTPHDVDQELRSLLTDIDELRNERNHLIHGMWGTTGPDNSVLVGTVRLERREIVRDIVVTASDLDDLVERILEATIRLKKILILFNAYV